LFISFCKKESDTQNKEDLTLISKTKIDVKEPSGLSFNSDKSRLFTVSDNSNKLYKISLKGDVLQEYNYTGNDLEGVCFVENGKIILAEERNKNLVSYNYYDNTIQNHNINYENSQENSGIEGVCFDNIHNNFYIVNEKFPRKILTLNNNFNIIRQKDITFANDLSGIYYDNLQNELWICSDESKQIFVCDTLGYLLRKYSIDVNKSEGIAVNSEEKTIYIISDSENTLYTYKY